MNPVEIIEKTRNGESLTAAEIRFMVQEYTAGKIPDYQVSAWLMAIYFRGLSKRETRILTKEMATSGDSLDFISEGIFLLDKHSTGGVADTTTLVVAPLVAAAGGKIGKMSGRGLGFTGGTLDKMEAIPGMRIQLTESEFREQIETCGLAVVGQSKELAPADGLLYALRDVTGTVESLPLIASSIMSKKLAAGAKGIVLDVKCGEAAFMKNRREAMELANLMVAIGNESGRNMIAVVSDMNIPLGSAIGNSLEVDEAVEVLSGGGNRRLVSLSLILAGALLVNGNLAPNLTEGKALAKRMLASGKGLAKFKEWVAAQGGDTGWIGRELLTKETNCRVVYAKSSGYLQHIQPLRLAHIAMELGAGRQRKEDSIDPQVGVLILAEVGDYIKKGQPLAKLYGKVNCPLDNYVAQAAGAFEIGGEKREPPLVYSIIGVQ